MKDNKSSVHMLLITWNFPPKVGGIEYLLSNLVKQIKSSMSVDIIAPYHDQADDSSSNIHRIGKEGLISFYISALFLGIKILRREKIDVLVGGSGLLTPLVYFLGKLFRTPTVVYTYGLDLTYKNNIYQLFIRNVLPGVDQVVAISRDTKSKAIDLGVPEGKISLIFPGIHAEQYDLNREQSVLKKKHNLTGKKVILYAGRLAKRKGVFEFITHSFPDIVRDHPKVVFCIVGDNPQGSLMHKEDILQKIQHEVDERGLNQYVRFFGWVPREQLLELYVASDIFILPAIPVEGDMEGFGIVMAEANAAGKPVVSSRIGGIPDAVVENKSAFLVDPGDWNGYSKAICRLLEDDSLRKMMGAYGAKRARSELDWSIIGKQFQDVICDVAALRE